MLWASLLVVSAAVGIEFKTCGNVTKEQSPAALILPYQEVCTLGTAGLNDDENCYRIRAREHLYWGSCWWPCHADCTGMYFHMLGWPSLVVMEESCNSLIGPNCDFYLPAQEWLREGFCKIGEDGWAWVHSRAPKRWVFDLDGEVLIEKFVHQGDCTDSIWLMLSTAEDSCKASIFEDAPAFRLDWVGKNSTYDYIGVPVRQAGVARWAANPNSWYVVNLFPQYCKVSTIKSLSISIVSMPLPGEEGTTATTTKSSCYGIDLRRIEVATNAYHQQTDIPCDSAIMKYQPCRQFLLGSIGPRPSYLSKYGTTQQREDDDDNDDDDEEDRLRYASVTHSELTDLLEAQHACRNYIDQTLPDPSHCSLAIHILSEIYGESLCTTDQGSYLRTHFAKGLVLKSVEVPLASEVEQREMAEIEILEQDDFNCSWTDSADEAHEMPAVFSALDNSPRKFTAIKKDYSTKYVLKTVDNPIVKDVLRINVGSRPTTLPHVLHLQQIL